MKKTVREIQKMIFFFAVAAAFVLQPFGLGKANAASPFGDYVVTTYNERNGLPTGEANVVMQTTDGYIWIGSYGGLIRYDGTTFKNYSEEKNGITSSSVRALFEDSKGRLWIGTNDAGVFVYQDGEFKKIKSEEEHAFLCIRDFAEGENGVIYAASNSGLAMIEKNTLMPFVDEDMNGNTIYSLGIDAYDRVWCSMSDGICAVVEYNEESKEPGWQVAALLSSDMFFDDAQAYCVATGRKGEIYIGSSGNKFVQVEFMGTELVREAMEITTYQTGSVNIHNRIHMCEDGTVLVSGLQGFGFVDSNGKLVEFGESKKASSVNAAVRDYEGNIWLASSAFGVVKYSEGCFETPNEAAGLTGKALNTVVRLGKEYYAGADDGLLAFNSNWKPVTNALTELLAGDRIRHMIAARNGTLWVTSYYGHGVVNYNPDNGEIICYGAADGLVSEGVRVLLQRKDGSIAVGTQDGISIIRDGKVVKNYKRDEKGLANATILCMAEDENGVLYAGTDGGGIFAIDGDTITGYGFSEGLGEGVVLRLLEDREGNGWFVSAGSSLYYLQDGDFCKLTNFEKSAGSIFDLYEKDGSIYMMQNSGILKVRKSLLLGEGEAQTVQYGFSHGLTGSLNANTWNDIDQDGVLYLSTRNGISMFAFGMEEDIQPRGIISEIAVDDKIYVSPDQETRIYMDKNVTRLTINFSTLSYTGTTNSGMSYQLEGFDETMTKMRDEKSGSISYTNLPGGDYTFCLKVYLLSDPDMSFDYYVNIHKDKKLTEHPGFWIFSVALIVAAVVGLAFLIARAKIMAARNRQREYQVITDQFFRAFAKMIDAKDKYTNGHSVRVACYSSEIAKRINMSEEDQERVFNIALMHDIGKIGIPDSILKKAGRLTEEEMNVIKTHPVIGGEILHDCTALKGISEGAQFHHERFDGTGYCEGLKGNEIPLIARIIGVADAYDAMSNARCYRKALDKEVIVRELSEGAGSQFDPAIVEIMLEMMEDGFAPVHL